MTPAMQHTAPIVPVELEVHPPERRARTIVVGSGCCTCCCCCSCCVHSLGGVLGAAIGSGVSSGPPLLEPNAPEELARAASRSRALVAYWLTFALLTLLGVAAAGAGESATVGLTVLAVCLPAVQLLASLLAIPVMLVMIPPDPGAAFAALGRLTLFTVVGTTIGVAATGALLGVGVAIAGAL